MIFLSDSDSLRLVLIYPKTDKQERKVTQQSPKSNLRLAARFPKSEMDNWLKLILNQDWNGSFI